MKSSTSVSSTTTAKPDHRRVRVALVVPHIFIHRDILPRVIFSPGELALRLAEGLSQQGVDVTLYAPGPVDTTISTVTADTTFFEEELGRRGDQYLDLLKKHPATFTALARQLQSESLARAFAAANHGEHDLVHVYTNEEDLALPFSRLCTKPVVFTHHDPFNFLVKYKNNFPKYADLNWISLSYAQRATMPPDTTWVANIYHGMPIDAYQPDQSGDSSRYVAFMGRIIQPKGVHLAIQAVKQYNDTHETKLTLKIAGKHYADESSDSYWREYIEPELGETVEYVGFLRTDAEKNAFLARARALLIPSLFDEPFGMVLIESLASGTPVIGLDSGAIPEIITAQTGVLVIKGDTDDATASALAEALEKIDAIRRSDCRADFEARFTEERMCREHAELYQRMTSGALM